MCRHLAYLGPPTSVGELLTRGPHSLRTQSWAPREMRGGGTINADGFGVAWWLPADAAPEDHGAGVSWHGGHRADPVDAARAEAAAAQQHAPGEPTVSRYRNAAPIWTDPAVEEVLPQLRSRAVLAAIRSATVGMPVERGACAPFTHGRWAFSHNGAIPDWRRALSVVAAQFGSPSLLEAESLTDSAALWVILRGLLEGASGFGPNRSAASATVSSASSVSVTVRSGSAPDVQSWSWTSHSGTGSAGAPDAVLRTVLRSVLAESPRARMNLLLGDGETIWATTWHHSLSVLSTDEYAVVASEPYDDDPRWEAIGDRMLVRVRPGWKSVESLEIELGRATS